MRTAASGRPDRTAALEAAMRRERSAIVVVNAHSRTARRSFQPLLSLLERRGFSVVAAHAVDDPARLQATVDGALAAHDAPLVIVGGGDGTVSEVVDCLAHRERVLGLLPLGTSNNFARTLGIPLGLEAAVDVIATGEVADVALGRIGDDHFANVASLGLSARVAATVPGWAKRHLGRLGYALTGLAAIARQSPFQATLIVDGVTHRVPAQQVVVANGRFHAGRPIAAEASVEDRRLIVHVIATRRRWRLVRALAGYFARLDDPLPDTLVLSGARVRIDCTPPQRVEIDGELKASTPVVAGVTGEALHVVVPRGFAGAAPGGAQAPP